MDNIIIKCYLIKDKRTQTCKHAGVANARWLQSLSQGQNRQSIFQQVNKNSTCLFFCLYFYYVFAAMNKEWQEEGRAEAIKEISFFFKKNFINRNRIIIY